MTALAATLAGDLLAEGRCTPACLLAREPDGCACRCAGEFHGALTDAEVIPGTGWWDAIPGGFKPERNPWHVRDGDGPVLETAADFRARWRGYATGPFAYVCPQFNGKWAVHELGCVEVRDCKDLLQSGLFEALLLARRCDAASPGQDPSAYGFRSWQEAQAVARLLTAIDWLWTDDLLPCLRELDRCLHFAPRPRLACAIAWAEEWESSAEEWGSVRDDPLVGPFLDTIERRWFVRRGLPAADRRNPWPAEPRRRAHP